MKNKGFTLIETIVVFTILSTLALVGIESIVEFQKNALLDGAANEFVSTLRVARTKSMAGQLDEGESPSYFAEDGLPKYGVLVEDDNTYSLIREYIDGTGSSGYDKLEYFTVGENLSLTTVGDKVVFDRVTGKGGPIVFTLQRTDGRGEREIEVNNKGITLRKL